ncbi:MAG: adenylate/guanylate cyclase domain-containing protein [Gemmatimonadaceae bacterium]
MTSVSLELLHTPPWSDGSTRRGLTADVPLFAGVDPRLVALITRDMLTTYHRGDLLCREGEAASHLFAIKTGRVSVTMKGGEPAQRGAGDLIGEQSFIDHTPRTATAAAITSVEVLRIPHTIVESLLSDRAFARNMLRGLSRKLTEVRKDRAEGHRQERLLFSEFRAHLSNEVAQKLVNSGLDYGQPRRIPAVVLFSDIRNFTPASASLEPEDVARQLSAYFDEIVDIIHAHGGMVDKFIGDAVMAVWGFVPAPVEELALSAYRCAQAMIIAANARTFAGAPMAIGVGLNAGEVFMGNVGGRGKRQFTVLGSPVNMAARYESASKTLGAPLAVGGTLARSLPLEDREELSAHADVPIKGAPAQTVYTWAPGVMDVLPTCS